MVELQEETEGLDSIPSIKEIILLHIKKISDICCEEFRPGYWEEKPTKTAGGIVFSKIYHPDSRKTFCNAVRFLGWLVWGYVPKESNFYKLLEKNKDFFEKYKNIKEEEDIEEMTSLCFKIFKEMNDFFVEEDFFDPMMFRNE